MLLERGTFKIIIYLVEISYIKFENTVINICFHINKTVLVKDINGIHKANSYYLLI